VPEAQQSPSLLRSYLEVLRRRARAIAAVTAILTLGAVGVSLLQDPVYRATASVLLQPKVSETLGTAQVTEPAAGVDNTELEVMRSELVREPVEDELGYEPDISLRGVEGTKVVRVAAEAPAARRAARDANAYARVYVRERRDSLIEELNGAIATLNERLEDAQAEVRAADAPLRELEAQIATASAAEASALERERDELAAQIDATVASTRARATAYQDQIDQLQVTSSLTVTGGAQVIAEAEVPDEPVSPVPIRNAGIGLGVGLVLGIALAFLLDQLDDRILSKDALEEAVGGLPTLGIIPVVAKAKRDEDRLISALTDHHPVGEAYRGLRTSVQFPALERQLRALQVTSADAGEGKTTTVANLGLALARAGKRVVLVDADLRRPKLAHLFGVTPVTGLAEILLGEVAIEEALVPVAGEQRLVVLATEGAPKNPPELLGLRQFAALVRSLADRADFVLVDTPPVLPVADAVTVAAVVDATLVVVAAERTDVKHVERAVELLEQVDATLLGTVLNLVPNRRGADTYYGYGYGNGNGYGPGDNGAADGGGTQGRAPAPGARRAGEAAVRPSSAPGPAAATPE
jgi:polysaccharide biosynthesis transport protein